MNYCGKKHLNTKDTKIKTYNLYISTNAVDISEISIFQGQQLDSLLLCLTVGLLCQYWWIPKLPGSMDAEEWEPIGGLQRTSLWVPEICQLLEIQCQPSGLALSQEGDKEMMTIAVPYINSILDVCSKDVLQMKNYKCNKSKLVGEHCSIGNCAVWAVFFLECLWCNLASKKAHFSQCSRTSKVCSQETLVWGPMGYRPETGFRKQYTTILFSIVYKHFILISASACENGWWHSTLSEGYTWFISQWHYDSKRLHFQKNTMPVFCVVVFGCCVRRLACE